MAQLVAIIGSGILTQAIGAAFNDTTKAVWLSSSIAILLTVLSPLLSQLADYWGRKWILVISSLCGFVGAIVASRARSMSTVIMGFVIIGLGCGCQPLLNTVASEILPRKQRPIAQTAINVGIWVGSIVGIVMGGALMRGNNIANYRIYMYVTAGIFCIATLGLIVAYNPPPRELQESLTRTKKLRKLDWIGSALLATGLALLSVALSWSRNPYPWTDARVSATFAIGACLLIIFTIFEWRFKKDGIVHHDLFRHRNFVLGLCTIFAEGLGFFAVNSYFVYEVGVFTGADLLVSGLHYLVVFVLAISAAIPWSLHMSKTRSLRLSAVVGFSLVLLFFICMITSTPSTAHGAYWAFAVILGFGFAIINTAIFVAVQLSTPVEMISTASALLISFRGLGGTIGLAINNTIFNDTLESDIGVKIAAAVRPLGLPSSSLPALIAAISSQNQQALATVPGITPDIVIAASNALESAYGVAFRNAWIASACFIFLAIVCRFLVSGINRLWSS